MFSVALAFTPCTLMRIIAGSERASGVVLLPELWKFDELI